MLDPIAEDSARDGLAEEVRNRIASDGEIHHENKWGVRKLAYEIDKKTEADYRWMRFSGSPDLLRELDRTLKITDGVLRFRIFRVDPDSPVVSAPPAVGSVAAQPDDDED